MTSTLAAHIRPLLVLMLVMVTIDVIGRLVALRRVVPVSDFLANMVSWGVETLARNAVFPVRYAAFVLVGSLVPWQLASHPATWALAYVLVDLAYYVKHRWLHNNGLLWALHMPHHSIRTLTADSALRLGWIQRLFDDFFYLPLALLGFPAWTLLMAVELNHVYQWWCHAEWIGRLKWLDPWLNTPSNHRVHHATRLEQVRSNYGSTFMIWDRLLGTYQPEPAESVTEFGVDIGYVGNNPVRFQLTPLYRYVRNALS
ncbi:MAG: sterol desaturase family protein [Alphaproteobacteria bacterium]|nr:sterol desaturase family protein [Alphaproteobacteria bacterium]